MKLWNNDTEIQFFKEALKNFASPEQLFYNLQSGYFAYVPKGLDAEGQTLQNRNFLIGQFTEKWCKTIFEPLANELGLFAVNNVVCEELGLSRQSSADLAKVEKILIFLGVPLSGRAIRYKSSLRCGLFTSIPNAIKNAA
ncbi:MAG: hypothetical protein WBJ84_09495 [Bacteroidales bacterium]